MSVIPTSEMSVAFLDLQELHQPIRRQLDDAWNTALETSGFIGGPTVARFESNWADYCGVDFCVGVANGTDALELVLAALKVGPGDEVIVPANTFVATAEAVVTLGATPVFVDVDPETLLVTPQAISSAITRRTRAVMVVHLYGQIPDMDPIIDVAAAAGIDVIEDAAQAHGATYKGRKAGSFGTAATFSFYPGKNLGALGDGGAVVTNNEALATEIRTLANHGRWDHHLHTHRGRNSRLDGLQGSALDIKLGYLDQWNNHRRLVHDLYVKHFDHTSVKMLSTPEHTVGVHHLEVIRVDNRDSMREWLASNGVATGIHYAQPCHKHPAFSEFDISELPIAEDAAEHQLSLPMHPTLTAQEVEYVASRVSEHL